MPGIAILRAHGYQPATSSLITWTGLTGLLLAPFGGYAFNLAAITAAICMGKEVDPTPTDAGLRPCGLAASTCSPAVSVPPWRPCSRPSLRCW
jgi:hypothetical protein